MVSSNVMTVKWQYANSYSCSSPEDYKKRFPFNRSTMSDLDNMSSHQRTNDGPIKLGYKPNKSKDIFIFVLNLFKFCSRKMQDLAGCVGICGSA